MQATLRKLDDDFSYVMSRIALFAISNHFTFSFTTLQQNFWINTILKSTNI
jgi:hypothetical protein